MSIYYINIINRYNNKKKKNKLKKCVYKKIVVKLKKQSFYKLFD